MKSFMSDYTYWEAHKEGKSLDSWITMLRFEAWLYTSLLAILNSSEFLFPYLYSGENNGENNLSHWGALRLNEKMQMRHLIVLILVIIIIRMVDIIWSVC